MIKFLHGVSLGLMAAVSFPCAGLAQAPEALDAQAREPQGAASALFPASDPANAGGWVLREDISDEFEGTAIDQSKWFVQGANGQYYIWKGRAPSQFAAHNVRVENGKLKLTSQWEPDFDFARDEGHEGNVYAMHDGQEVPVTAAGVISRKRFLNGYMEVRSKAGDAAVTSSFWAIGYQSELDVFEQMGRPKLEGNIKDNYLKSTVHDWSPPAVRPTKVFGHTHELPYRVADEFHVYGAEWGEDYLKTYLDGELVYSVTQADVGEDWVLTNPLEIWLDMEIFTWLGLPHEDELPVDFEIDYVRVWQKPHLNLLDRAFFGFEGPILFEEFPRPLKLVPESSKENDYQKFWAIGDASSAYLSITEDTTFASGTQSLMFSHDGELTVDEVSALAPAGSVDIPAGDFVFSTKLWIAPGSVVRRVRMELSDSPLALPPIDLAQLPKGEWVTVEQPFTRKQPSTAKDRLEISIRKQDLGKTGGSSMFIDEISIVRSKEENQ